METREETWREYYLFVFYVKTEEKREKTVEKTAFFRQFY